MKFRILLFLVLGLGVLTVWAWPKTNQAHLNPKGMTVQDRITVPAGYERVSLAGASFGNFLRTLPLKKNGATVHHFDGTPKLKPGVYCAVVDLPVGDKDLQQCADAVMRLRGEYLYHEKRYSDIHFNFLADGKPRYFTKYAGQKRDYDTFVRYMEYVFGSANTASLREELKPVPMDQLRPGDVLIQKGTPYGHAEMVLDVAAHSKTGKRLYLLAQSYMPAQDIQILNNPMNPGLSPWYELSEETIETPEWTFTPKDLRRFKE